MYCNEFVTLYSFVRLLFYVTLYSMKNSIFFSLALCEADCSTDWRVFFFELSRGIE